MRPIDEILHTAIALNATDIHIQAGLPPVYRVQKRLIQKGGVRLGPQEAEELVFSLMTDQQKQIFREKLFLGTGLQDWVIRGTILVPPPGPDTESARTTAGRSQITPIRDISAGTCSRPAGLSRISVSVWVPAGLSGPRLAARPPSTARNCGASTIRPQSRSRAGCATRPRRKQKLD